MLSDQSLERVSVSYRRGYRDGAADREQHVPDNGIADINDDTIGGTIRPFANFDYSEGYKAGANDAKWERIYRERNNPKGGSALVPVCPASKAE